MYEHRSIAIILPAWNEAGKIGRAVTRMPRDLVDVVLVVDDGSTDGTAEEAERAGAQVLRHDRNQGVGAAIRTGIEWAQAHDIALTGIMAGDDQDDPREIVLLARSIVEKGADFVQGSRYVKGGRRLNQPLSRTIMTRGYSVLFSLCVLRPVTDATNGFKLFRTEVTRSMNLRQPWLDRYELEPYLLYEAIRRRLRVAEIPVTKYYPADRAVGYTKMRAILDWWRISRPMVLLTLRLRR
ncbi:MAG TPA: glycosyltransferase family 2 protein [Candidatus Dormibacteraeota bacterium]